MSDPGGLVVISAAGVRHTEHFIRDRRGCQGGRYCSSCVLVPSEITVRSGGSVRLFMKWCSLDRLDTS